jgi:hypothetical protein
MLVSCACGRHGHTRMAVCLLPGYLYRNRLHVSSEVNTAVNSALSRISYAIDDDKVAICTLCGPWRLFLAIGRCACVVFWWVLPRTRLIKCEILALKAHNTASKQPIMI